MNEFLSTLNDFPNEIFYIDLNKFTSVVAIATGHNGILKRHNVDVIKINKHRPDWFSGLIIHGCSWKTTQDERESEACVPSSVFCQDYFAARRLMSNIITTLMRYGVNQRDFLWSCYQETATSIIL